MPETARVQADAAQAAAATRAPQTSSTTTNQTSSSDARSTAAPPLRLVEGEPAAEQEKDPGVLAQLALKLAREYAPELEPILQRGLGAWLEEKILAGLDALFELLAAPIKDAIGVAEQLSPEFAKVMDWVRDAAAKAQKGDCTPLSEAAQRIEEAVEAFTSKALDKVKELASKVKGFFAGIWDKVGAPIWETLKDFGGAVWAKVEELAKAAWEKTATIRKWFTDAWAWLKRKLGIGDGPDEQDGLLQWIQRKAKSLWETRLKPLLERYKKPLLAISAILALLSPAGPLLLAGGAIAGIVAGVRWIKQHLRDKAQLIKDQGYLRGVLLPGLLNAIKLVSPALSKAVEGLIKKIGSVVSGIGDAVAAVAGSIFRAITKLLEWVMGGFKALSAWATELLGEATRWLGRAFDRVTAFFQPLLDFLMEVAGIVVDILKLPLLVAKALWKRIPACIRDPIEDFLLNQILKRIPLFKTLTETLPAVWTKLKAAATLVLRKVFKEGDLPGAALEVFRLMLAALEVPLHLVKSIWEKALAARDLILAEPVKFLINIAKALALGLRQFASRAVEHLLKGLGKWLFGAFAKAGITPPSELSVKGVLVFVLEVLGVTFDNILARLEPKIGPERVRIIRTVAATLGKLWSWFNTLMAEGPEGVWKRIKEQAGDLWQGLLDSAVAWLTEKVTETALKKLASFLDPTGIMALVQGIISVYKALEAAVEYAKQWLEILDGFFDSLIAVAKGVLAGAADTLENLMELAIAPVLGLLSKQVNLDLPKRIKDMVEALRAKVNKGIDWVLDKLIAAIKSVLGAVKSAVGKVLQWWKLKKKFPKNEDGEEHSFYFDGSEAAAELIVRSEPTRLVQFIEKRAEGASADDQKAIAAIRDQLKELKKAEKALQKAKDDKDDAAKTTATDEIEKIFEAIAPHVDVLLNRQAREGTRQNPFEIEWPGPPLDKYPVLYFGGPTTEVLSQRMLANRVGTMVGGQTVKSFDIKRREALPGSSDQIGLSPEVIECFDGTPKKAMGAITRATTPGGEVLGKVLDEHGFNYKKKGVTGVVGDDLQLDHVQEIQLGGANELWNMWPLKSSLNSSKGSSIGNLTVKVDGKETKISALKFAGKKYYVRIASFK